MNKIEDGGAPCVATACRRYMRNPLQAIDEK
jgi:hypothetical protein